MRTRAAFAARAGCCGRCWRSILFGAAGAGRHAYRTARCAKPTRSSTTTCSRWPCRCARACRRARSAAARPAGEHGYDDFDFVVQVWTADGMQDLRVGSPRRVLPQRAVLGFSDVPPPRHRLSGLLDADQRPRHPGRAGSCAVRERLAGALALRTVVPIAMMVPLLMLVIWWVVTRSLRPVAAVRRQVASRAADDLVRVQRAGPARRGAAAGAGAQPAARAAAHGFRGAAQLRRRCRARAALAAGRAEAAGAEAAPRRRRQRAGSGRRAARRPASIAHRAWSSNCWCWRAGRRMPAGSGSRVCAGRMSSGSWCDAAASAAQARGIDLGLPRRRRWRDGVRRGRCASCCATWSTTRVKYTPPAARVDVDIRGERRPDAAELGRQRPWHPEESASACSTASTAVAGRRSRQRPRPGDRQVHRAVARGHAIAGDIAAPRWAEVKLTFPAR